MKISFRWILISIACALRFVGLSISPPAFYIDEAMGAAHSLCYQQTGHDLFTHIGLFSKIDFGGFQSAPFIMSGALWTFFFGPGAISFRSWIAFVGVLTVLGTHRLVINATGQRDKALWATLFAACLPWAFQFSRISWDAPLATCFLVWGLATIYIQAPFSSARVKFYIWLLAGFLFALASYTYAPMRLNAALFLILLPGINIRTKATVLGAFALLNLPVLPFYADAEFVARSKLLALTSDYPGNSFRGLGPGGLFIAYVTQLLRHFSPNFLLLHGDANLRHSIQTFGMLDAVTAIGCLVGLLTWIYKLVSRRTYQLLRSRDSLLLRLALLGIFAGITPAALTWEGVPHAIRAMGAWPFFAVLAAEGWTFVVERWTKLRFAVALASALCFALYLDSYFTNYPKIAGIWFDEPIYLSIMKTHRIPADYGAVARSYYRMAIQGESCEQIQTEFQR